MPCYPCNGNCRPELMLRYDVPFEISLRADGRPRVFGCQFYADYEECPTQASYVKYRLTFGGWDVARRIRQFGGDLRSARPRARASRSTVALTWSIRAPRRLPRWSSCTCQLLAAKTHTLPATDLCCLGRRVTFWAQIEEHLVHGVGARDRGREGAGEHDLAAPLDGDAEPLAHRYRVGIAQLAGRGDLQRGQTLGQTPPRPTRRRRQSRAGWHRGLPARRHPSLAAPAQRSSVLGAVTGELGESARRCGPLGDGNPEVVADACPDRLGGGAHTLLRTAGTLGSCSL